MSHMIHDRRPRAYITRALIDLRSARESLRQAGADKAAEAVNRALKSAEGALRHAEGKETRQAPRPGATRYGTAHFISLAAADGYYARQGIPGDQVAAKLAAGEIAIGPPDLKPGERLTTIDNGARYAIEED